MSKVAKSVALYLNNGTKELPVWVRIKKSTALSISYNAETEDFDYIADEVKTTEVKQYAPSIDQDLAILPKEADYEAINEMRKKLPISSEAHKEFLTVFINDGNNTDGFYAEKQDAVVTFSNYNATDGKINFNIAFCGTRVQGKATIENGEPSFVADSK